MVKLISLVSRPGRQGARSMDANFPPARSFRRGKAGWIGSIPGPFGLTGQMDSLASLRSPAGRRTRLLHKLILQFPPARGHFDHFVSAGSRKVVRFHAVNFEIVEFP